MDARRASDRWVTPGVVMVGLLVVGGLLALVVVAVAWLTVRGYDPEPVVRLVLQAVGAAGAVLTAALQLASRRTTTKVERNTGVLGRGVLDALDELDELRGRHAYTGDQENSGPAPAALGTDHGQVTESTQRQWQEPAGVVPPYSDTPAEDLRDTAWYRQ